MRCAHVLTLAHHVASYQCERPDAHVGHHCYVVSAQALTPDGHVDDVLVDWP